MTYAELKGKYRISYSEKDKNSNEYDIVVSCVGRRYGINQYIVYKNAVGLSNDDLATICDEQEPPFGYSAYGDSIDIYTD